MRTLPSSPSSRPLPWPPAYEHGQRERVGDWPLQGGQVARFDALVSTALDPMPVSELGGTRHQSAARFVRQHPDCSVLVSSQDGRMTLFSWEKKPGHVVAVSGLEHFAWGEEN